MKRYFLNGLVWIACVGVAFAQDDGDIVIEGGIVVGNDPFAAEDEEGLEELEGGRAYTLTFEVFSTSIAKAAAMKRSKKTDEVIYEGLIDSVEKGEVSQDKLMEVRSRIGHQARVEMIREYIYPTEFASPKFAKLPARLPDGFKDFGQFITPALPTSFETKNLGDMVEVKLQEGPDETEAMTGSLIFTHSSLKELKKWGKEESEVTMPNFDVQRLQAAVRFESGQPVFVGSLADPTRADQKKVWMVFATATFGELLSK